MIPKRHIKHEESVDGWLMSYADMITLLLCFFIIFVSVSEPKQEKISEIADGMVGKFGSVQYTTPFGEAMRSLQESVEKHKLYRDVAIIGGSRSLSVELASMRFFKNKAADIDDAMIPVLDELIAAIKQIDPSSYSVIIIESHTDDTPPQSGLYANNWELSSIRAAKIIAYALSKGLPKERLKAEAYADSRPKVPNFDAQGNPIEENRLSNQRVFLRLE